MGDQDPNSIRRLDPERRVGNRTDNSHASLKADLIAVVVSETGDHRAAELAQRWHDDRRDEIAGKNDQLATLPVKFGNGKADVIDVIVSVGKDADTHDVDL